MRVLVVAAALVAGCGPAQRSTDRPRDVAIPWPSPRAIPAASGSGALPASPKTILGVWDPTLLCSPESRERKAAIEAISRIDREVDALADTDPVATVQASLAGLLESRCLQIAYRIFGPLQFDSAVSVKHWWRHGGSDWFKETTQGLPTDSAGRIQLVTRPDPPHALFAENPGTFGIPELLCPAADASCGQTRIWQQRAEQAMRDHESREFPQSPEFNQLRDCKKAALESPSQDQFLAWADCVARNRERAWALALGDFRAPTHGWLLVQGRRLQPRMCDQIGAFELGSGSFYTVSWCEPPAGATAPKGVVSVQTQGARVSVDQVREAAWMMLMIRTARKEARESGHLPVPAGIEVELPPEGMGFGAGRDYDSGGRTRLGWQWRDADQDIASGLLTWPVSYDGAEEHAARLLAEVEASARPGCPPIAPPKLPPLLQEGAHRHPLQHESELRGAWTTLLQSVCKRGPVRKP